MVWPGMWSQIRWIKNWEVSSWLLSTSLIKIAMQVDFEIMENIYTKYDI